MKGPTSSGVTHQEADGDVVESFRRLDRGDLETEGTAQGVGRADPMRDFDQRCESVSSADTLTTAGALK
jgi:hypothetical protein